MKHALTFAAVGFALAVAPPSAAQDSEYGERSDAAFAELVEGRVAGEARSCIPVFHQRRLEVVDHVGLTYQQGSILWVARARNPESLTDSDIPIVRRWGSSLCRHDPMRTVDRASGAFTDVLFIDDWVPYTEVDEG